MKWLDTLGDEDQLFASQITQAQLLSDAHRQTDPIEREEWIARITKTLPQEFGSRLLQFGQWDELPRPTLALRCECILGVQGQ